MNRTYFALMLGFIALAGSARAASFAETDLLYSSNNFGYLSAASNSDLLLINLNADSASTVSINGATFTGGGTTGNNGVGVSYAVTDVTGTYDPNAYSLFIPNSATDPAVNTLVSSFFYGIGSPTTIKLTVSGLTPGDVATLTILGAAFADKATTGRLGDLTGSEGGSIQWQQNNYVDPTHGGLSTLAYTATVPPSGILSISEQADNGVIGDQFFGFTVSQAPEPSSLILMAIGAIWLLAASRRRRRGTV